MAHSAHSTIATGQCSTLGLRGLPAGSDGTGQAILPQLQTLTDAGFEVRAMYMPPANRSDWRQLTEDTVKLIEDCLAAHVARDPQGHGGQGVVLLAESFGGCLALR